MSGPAHRSAEYQRAQRALKARKEQPCCLCGEAIDYRAHYPHPRSFSAEHLVPARYGGDHTTLAPAHLGCQWSQGVVVTNNKRRGRGEPSSGVW